MDKLVIVFGISGVGKTTVCSQYAQTRDYVRHYSASKLIELHRSTAAGRSRDQMLLDQLKLVEIVKSKRCDDSEHLILLDAHSLIVVQNEEVIVPTAIIAAMKPDGMIFLWASPEELAARRSFRGDAVDTITSFDEIKRLQLKALKSVECYSKELSSPLSIIDTDSGIDLGRAIDNFGIL